MEFSRSRFFLLLACCVFVLSGGKTCNAQSVSPDVRYKHLSLEQGLSQSSPNAILRDSQGYMWFGTQDGLNRYDGYQFTIFKHNDQDSLSLTNNYVTAIIEDSRRDLWIGTYAGGISVLDHTTGKFKRIAPASWGGKGIDVHPIMSIVEDHSQNIWVAVWNNCVSRYNPFQQTWTHFIPNSSDPGSLVDARARNFIVDRSGRVWVCTFGGLDRFDSVGQKFIHYHATPEGVAGLPDDRIWCAFEDRDGDLWFGKLENGVALYDWHQQAFVKTLTAGSGTWGLNSNHIISISQSDDGVLWIGSMDAGLIRMDKRSGQVWIDRRSDDDPSGLSGDAIVSLYNDGVGGMWVGADGAGINHYDPHRFKFRHLRHVKNTPQSLGNPSVRSLCEDRTGLLWIGMTGGLDSYDLRTGEYVHYQCNPARANSLSSAIITAILEDHDGQIWVATYGGGLNLFDRQKRTFRVFRSDPKNPATLGNDYIMTLKEGGDGPLWIGTFGGGLTRMDRRTFACQRFGQTKNAPDQIGGNFIYAIHEEPSGELWLGTYGAGITVFNPQTRQVRVYRHDPSQASSLSNNTIHDIYRDTKGNLWLATMGGGLDCFEYASRVFTHITESDGLPNNMVYGIVEDSTGRLWMSTNKGISCYDPIKKAFRNYGLSDGLQSLEFNQGAFCRGSQGKLFFGGINGVNIIEPEHLPALGAIAPVVITQVKVMDREVPVSTSPQQMLDLAPDQNFVSFMFSVLDYTASEQNSYRYMLEGLDRSWIDAGTRHYAAYTDLQPGDYVLRVQGRNSDGVWNREGASLQIRVNPPYWKTLWFRALVIATLIGMAFGFYLNRMRRLRKERAAQAEFSRKLNGFQENERKRIAGELHDSLGQNLLTIRNRLGQCEDMAPPGQVLQHEINDISGTVQQTIDEVREISADLHPHMLDRLGLTRTIESTVKKCAASAGMTIRAAVDNVDHLFLPVEEINIFRIIQEGLNNAVKHSRASECTVTLSKNDTTCDIVLEDDGCGFVPAQPRVAHESYGGFGLMHMAERVRLLDGAMEIVSSPGNGTRLHISLPLPVHTSGRTS